MRTKVTFGSLEVGQSFYRSTDSYDVFIKSFDKERSTIGKYNAYRIVSKDAVYFSLIDDTELVYIMEDFAEVKFAALEDGDEFIDPSYPHELHLKIASDLCLDSGRPINAMSKQTRGARSFCEFDLVKVKRELIKFEDLEPGTRFKWHGIVFFKTIEPGLTIVEDTNEIMEFPYYFMVESIK